MNKSELLHWRLEQAGMHLLLNLLVTVVFLGVLPAGLIVGLAGRRDLWNVWAYAVIGILLLSFQAIVIYRRSPFLLKDRMQPPASDRVRMPTYVAFVLLRRKSNVHRTEQTARAALERGVLERNRRLEPRR